MQMEHVQTGQTGRIPAGKAYTCREAVEYINSIPKFTKKNKLSNTAELLARLGHPEETFRIIHVAGTNGKGSVCAFLAGLLEASGCRTGLFTSPHLVRINERFQVNRRETDDDTFAEAFNIVRETAEGMISDGFYHPTYFEFLFAMGMVIFRKEKIDCLVMETGLGGRLDATNTIADPVCCVITSISLDHTFYLGDTVGKIAWEKAGIIKEGVPVIYDAGCEEAREVIEKRACEMHAEAIPLFHDEVSITERTDKGIAFVLKNRYYDNVTVHLPFPADYQAVNCALAMTAFRAAAGRGLPPAGAALPDDRRISEILSEVKWSGRMETVLPDIVIDGAHNADGIRQFRKTVERISERRKVSLLFAAVADKDYEKMIREICRGISFENVTVTQVGGSRKVAPKVFADIFRSCQEAPVYEIEDVREAFRRAAAMKGDGMLFCVGSLYLAGEIRAMLEETYFAHGCKRKRSRRGCKMAIRGI